MTVEKLCSYCQRPQRKTKVRVATNCNCSEAELVIATVIDDFFERYCRPFWRTKQTHDLIENLYEQLLHVGK